MNAIVHEPAGLRSISCLEARLAAVAASRGEISQSDFPSCSRSLRKHPLDGRSRTTREVHRLPRKRRHHARSAR